jgi:hypothetical protein
MDIEYSAAESRIPLAALYDRQNNGFPPRKLAR